MNNQLKIKRIQILTNAKTLLGQPWLENQSEVVVDKVALELDTPTPFPNLQYEAWATVEVQKGYGEEWVRRTFPNVPYEVIDIAKHIERTQW